MSVARLAALFLLAATASAQAQTLPPGWIADVHGCRMWNLSPEAGETIVWSGACVGGYGEGHGTLVWYWNGSMVETDDADFHHGKMNGHVVMDDPGGDHFDGEFRDHKPNGEGTLRAADGQIYSGRWSNGCFNDGKRKMNFGVPMRDCELTS